MNLLFLFLGVASFSLTASGQTPAVTFRDPPAEVEVYDFAEVVISAEQPTAANPFTEVTVAGEFRREGGDPVRVDGFCDSPDGRLFRIRFMPSQPGRYDYTIIFVRPTTSRTARLARLGATCS